MACCPKKNRGGPSFQYLGTPTAWRKKPAVTRHPDNDGLEDFCVWASQTAGWGGDAPWCQETWARGSPFPCVAPLWCLAGGEAPWRAHVWTKTGNQLGPGGCHQRRDAHRRWHSQFASRGLAGGNSPLLSQHRNQLVAGQTTVVCSFTRSQPIRGRANANHLRADTDNSQTNKQPPPAPLTCTNNADSEGRRPPDPFKQRKHLVTGRSATTCRRPI